jgi:hypothetical protein
MSFGGRKPAARRRLGLCRGLGVAIAALIAVSAAATEVQASATGRLVYHGGPVLTHPATTYMIYWQGTTGTLSPTYIGDVAQFIRDWNQSSTHAVLTQYYQLASRKEYVSNVVNYGGTATDDNAFPRKVLTQGELAREVRAVVRAHGWPESYGANYVVLLPPEASTNVDACAWHNWVPDVAASKKIFYSIIPYYSGSRLCPMPGGPYPHGEDVDNAIDRVSHELSELETDPWNTELANDPNKRTNTSWYTGTGDHEEEVGDLCRNNGRAVYGARDPSTGADVLLHGRPYLIQGEWSNADGKCWLGLPAPSGPHFAWLRRCAIIDEGSGGFHYWVGIYSARNVSCGKARFVFRRTSHSPDRYVTVTRGHNPWLVWRDGWGCDGHSLWVCLYRFRNPIAGVTRIAYSAECDGGAGCPARLHISQLWPGSRAWWPGPS